MWRPQTVAIRQGPRANTHHTLQGYMISKVSEWATPDSKDSNWFSFTLDLPMISCIKWRVWRQVTCFQILTPPFLAVSSQENHLKTLSPSFFFLYTYLPTYPFIHPSIHPSSTFIYPPGCGKEEKRKYKEGDTLKTANAQINSNCSDNDRQTRA